MSNEVKEPEEKECKCFCKSEGFRKFLTIALGTFVGVYCALSLFSALHKPPMFSPHQGFRNCPCKMMHHHHFVKPNMGDVKNLPPQGQEKRAPFERQVKEADD